MPHGSMAPVFSVRILIGSMAVEKWLPQASPWGCLPSSLQRVLSVFLGHPEQAAELA